MFCYSKLMKYVIEYKLKTTIENMHLYFHWNIDILIYLNFMFFMAVFWTHLKII